MIWEIMNIECDQTRVFFLTFSRCGCLRKEGENEIPLQCKRRYEGFPTDTDDYDDTEETAHSDVNK